MSEETSLGALLREARERRGETLEQVQQQTAISLGLLRELESDEFRVEPVYARLAAVNYAAYLGLDSEATTLFDRQYGRPDIPAPSYSRDYGRSPFPVLATRLPAFIGPVPAVLVIAGGAAIAAAVVLLAIFLSGAPEEPAPPSAGAGEIPPALPLAGGGNPLAEVEPDPGGAGFPPISALETPPASLAETSIASDSADAGVGEAAAVGIVEEGEAVDVGGMETLTSRGPPVDTVEEGEAVNVAVPGASDSGTALEEEPEGAERPGVPDLAAPLVLRAEAIDSTWVRIEWDGGAGAAEEIIPGGESREWEAADNFLVFAGRPHGVRFYLQGQLLGGGRLGDPTRVLRFRASAEQVVLLRPDLTPFSAFPIGDSDADAIPGEPRTR